MPTKLFSEFSSSDKESWRKRVEKELKGTTLDPEQWRLAESVFIEPYYTSAEVDWQKTEDLQRAQRTSTGWLNAPMVRFESATRTNSKIRAALASGADAIMLDLGDRNLPSSELTKTLHSVKLSDSFIYFVTDKNPGQLFSEISKGAGYYLKGGIANDPVAQWTRKGSNLTESLEKISEVLLITRAMKDFRPLMIESHIYHEAGADPVQELAFMISAMVICIDYLTDHGITPLHALNRFFFSVSIGTDYITEIAKLRALRHLYKKITRAYGLPDSLCNAFIQAQTSRFYHSEISGQTNMLRRTSEAMSAVTGGCDVLTVFQPGQTDESADRIAKNTSLLMTQESHMDQVCDASSGSYLIENMSIAISEAAWKLFLELEEKGGMIKCFETGFIQSEIEKAWLAKSDTFNKTRVMIGVNKYREPHLEVSNVSTDEIISDSPLLKKRRLEDGWIAK